MVDSSLRRPLDQHRPAWAKAALRTGSIPDGQSFEQLTLVLARSAEQEQALDELLDDQQNPGSPNFHRWLTADDLGARFGLSDADLAAITGWLASEGLHVSSIAPTRTAIRFGGTAANVARAFRTTLGIYTIRGSQRWANDTEPNLPQALAPAIRAVHGLSTPAEHPMHTLHTASSATPNSSATPDLTRSGVHYVTPADFNLIYDVPSSYTGAGVTIGIVSWARVSTADLDNFRSITSTGFPNPTVVVPSAYGGADPGAACTTTSCPSSESGGQNEATLDVIRAGGTAPGASLLLVAASPTASTDNQQGLGADVEYMIYTNPVPVQVLTMSFGACESDAGSSGVAYWNNLFQTAAGEGISVFVSSGDSAAAGCDTSLSAPPTIPVANSPNYICSSAYVTCAGGTEFADTASPSTWWSSSNSSGDRSALSYIPEGGWNDSTTSSVAGSGGGVSNFVATPSWQTGPGVSSARAGRYTPDVAFSSSLHDGYFACAAVAGGSCVTSNGSYSFVYEGGTSAAAPSMAGVAALLDQKLGTAQGNLNPELYALASGSSASSIFHDVTPTTSGISSCSIAAPSLCNNSTYSSSAGVVQQGYLVATGYDEVTGLGSLDVANFLSSYSSKSTPTVTVSPASASITTVQSLSVPITVHSSTGTPTGTVLLTSGSYASSSTTLSTGAATILVPSGKLSAGADTLTVSYTPDSTGLATYTASTGTATVTVTRTTPTVNASSGATSITSAQTLTVSVSVSAGAGAVTPTGTVAVTSGSYTSAAIALTAGAANVTLTAGSLTAGADSLTVTYTPDTAGSALYNTASGSAGSVTVSRVAPSVTVSSGSSSTTTAQPLSVTITVSAGTATATGTVVLSSGSYSSAAITLASGAASVTIPAGALATGADTLTAAYTPDSSSSGIYTNASGTASVSVSKATPTVTVSAAYSSIPPGQSLSVAVTVAGASGAATPTGSVQLASGSYSASLVLSSGAASFSIPAGTLAAGADTLTAAYTPDSASTALYNTNSGTAQVTVAKVTPAVSVSASPSSFTTLQSTTLTITVAGNTGNPLPTGSVVVSGGGYTSAATMLANGAAPITLPARSLAAGSNALTAAYTPDTPGAVSFNAASGATSVLVSLTAPALTVSASPSTITSGQSSTVSVTVSGGSGNPAASGSVVITSGSYASPAIPLSSGAGSIGLPASSLAIGTNTLTATYTPDSPAATTYKAVTGTATVTVNRIAPTVTVSATPASINTQQSTTITVAVTGGSGNATASGSVVVTNGSYTSASATLANGSASIAIPAGTLAVGAGAVTATYTPDTTAATTYSSASGVAFITVSRLTPTVAVTPTASTLAFNQSLSVPVTVSAGSSTATPTGWVVLTGDSYASAAAALTSGTATVTVPANTFPPGAVTLTATYTPDTAAAANYNSATGSTAVTYTPTPTFTLSAGPVNLMRGASGTSTVTVTPLYGFTGTIALTAAITSAPAGAAYAPSLGFGSTQPVSLSGTNAATATLTIGTLTANAIRSLPVAFGSWHSAGGAALAGLLLLFAPRRMRRIRALLGALSLFLALATGTSACTSTSAISGTPVKLTPTVTVTPAASSLTNAQALTVSATVAGSGGTPTGTATLTSGTFTSSADTLSSGAASFTIPAGSLAVGSNSLTVNYTPDTVGSATYNSAAGSAAVTVQGTSTAGTYIITIIGTSSGTSGSTTATTTLNLTVQ